MSPRVTATSEALAVIGRLRATHGPLAFFQSGGCCDGTAPMCFVDGELPLAPDDIRIGEIGGVPFYIDADQDERWGKPRFLIDVASGAAEGFSLEALGNVHFVTRSEGDLAQSAEG